MHRVSLLTLNSHWEKDLHRSMSRIIILQTQGFEEMAKLQDVGDGKCMEELMGRYITMAAVDH